MRIAAPLKNAENLIHWPAGPQKLKVTMRREATIDPILKPK